MNHIIETAFEEDLGPAYRDISVESLGEAAYKVAVGQVLYKTSGVVCGSNLLEPIVRFVESLASRRGEIRQPVKISRIVTEGTAVRAGTITARLKGPVATLLTAERTLLNFMQRLSGIATLTRKYVESVKNTDCKIVDTRKTTPGMRDLEKYAVRTGGASNHRFGLFDMIMLKDNHIAAYAGDVNAAICHARQICGLAVRIEVETSSLEQVKAAFTAKADVIMLDNMSVEAIRECVKWVDKRVLLEASGGITLDNVQAIAATGVDYISIGALTHSAGSIDISMKTSSV